MQHKSICVTNIQIRRPDLCAGPAVVELVAEVRGPPVEAGAGAVGVRVHPPVHVLDLMNMRYVGGYCFLQHNKCILIVQFEG